MNSPKEALYDCDKCLELDPVNVKALLRKAQALSECKRYRDSFYVYQNVVRIDPNNVIAQNFLTKLNEQFGDFPAENATR